MNIVSLKRLARFINTNMAFLAFSPAMMVALNLIKPQTGYIALVPMFLIVNFQFVFREYIKSFFLFLICNLGCFAAGFLFRDHILVFAAYMAFILLSVIVSFAIRIKPAEDVRVKPLVVYYLAVAAVCEILIFKLDLAFLKRGILISSIIYLMLYFVCKYISDYTDFLHEVRDSKHVPFSQINRSSFIMLAGFFAIALIVVILSVFIPFGDFVWAILSAIGHGLLFLLRLFFRNSGEVIDEPILDEGPSNMNPDMSAFAGGAETSAFWVILEKIVVVATTVLVAGAIIAGIIYAIYNIIKKFNENTHIETDEVEFLNPFDKAEKVKVMGTVRRSIFEIFAPPNEAKIRKIFYKAASGKSESAIGKTPKAKELQTPTELLPENETLTKLYEKARYSNTPCSREDVLAARESVKS